MQQGSILPFLKKPKAQRPENSQPEHSRSGQPYHPRPSNHSSRGSPSAKSRGQGPDRRRNMDLKKIADETKVELPKVIQQLSGFQALESSVHDLDDLDSLNLSYCPGYELPSSDVEAGKKGTRIKIFDTDTFDAAIKLDPDYTATTHLSPSSSSAIGSSGQAKDVDQIMEDASIDHTRKPVAVLNLASERSAGGGWQNGALAQEEALCYRSSLYLSLHKNYYPLPSLSAIYSPSVLLIRDAMSRGHTLLVPLEQPGNLPVTSVISVAALRYPALTTDGKSYKDEGQRVETKRKIRLTLRLAALKGHTKLVLGALGCGVFGNPPKEVAECFLEVMREKEFLGGWWEEVVFAIMDNVKGVNGGKDGVGNYGQFYRVLDGQIV